MSHQELHSKAALEKADLQTQRRLRDVQLLGCARNVADLDDFAEVSELPQINFTPPSWTNSPRLTRNSPGDY